MIVELVESPGQDRIRSYALENYGYPDYPLPRGAQAAIARALGVSRERVGQVIVGRRRGRYRRRPTA